MGVLYNVSGFSIIFWELCIILGGFVYCLWALSNGWGFCIMCGAVYNVLDVCNIWGLCIMFGILV